MRNSHLYFLLLVISLVSCSSTSGDKQDKLIGSDTIMQKPGSLKVNADSNSKQPIKDREEKFALFLKAFKQVSLPIVIRGCEFNSLDTTMNKLPFYNSDTLFVPFCEGLHPYFTFKTNGEYYAVIALGAADCMVPILTTYDKEGMEIDAKAVNIGDCGAGPGFSCHEYMTIKNDFTLFTSDTISEWQVDSLSNNIPGTETKYVVYKTGRILSNGKIELSGEEKKDLK